MKPFVELTTIYTDLPDLIELEVRASNGYFAGVVALYELPEIPATIIQKIRGFPSSNKDSREIVLETLDPNYAGGGARLRFYCNDPLGHAMIEVTLQTATLRNSCQSVNLIIPVVAGDIDSFVQQLEKMAPELGAAAILESSA